MRSISDVLENLDYDFNNFELQHFLDHVQAKRNRELFVAPIVFPLDISALWIYTEQADYIFFRSTDHQIHQTHSILHEIAHIVLDHKRVPIKDILPNNLFLSLHFKEAFGRLRKVDADSCNHAEEREAEAFVFEIQEKIMAANRMDQLLGTASSIRRLNNYVEGMGFNV